MKSTARLNFDFPRKEYPYLKMLCAEQGMNLEGFATELLLKAIEEYEDCSLAKKARKRLKEMKQEDNISFGRACDLAGWDEDEEKG